MGRKPFYMPWQETIPALEGHVHTNYTDGQNSVAEMAEAAVEAGLEVLVFTEHVNRGSTWFWDFLKEVQEVQGKYRDKLKIYSGLEAKALNWWGELDATPEMMEAADVVMGVVHTYTDHEGNPYDMSKVCHSDAIKIETAALLGLLWKGQIDILGHPGGTCIKHFGPYNLSIIRGIIRDAAVKGKAVEISSRYHQNWPVLYDLCKENECKLSFGSDAHSAAEIGLMYKKFKESGAHE